MQPLSATQTYPVRQALSSEGKAFHPAQGDRYWGELTRQFGVRTCVNIYNRVSLVSAWTHNLSNLSFVTPVLISRHFKICTVHCRGYNQDRLGEVRDATNIEYIIF